MCFFPRPLLKCTTYMFCCGLVSCGLSEEGRLLSLINKTVDEAVIEQDELVYKVGFIPLFSGPFFRLNPPDDLRLEIYDSGLPTLMVRRNDNAPLEAGNFETAKTVAAIACMENPDWNIGKNPAALEKYYPAFSRGPGYYKGSGFIKNGAWFLFEACE